MNRVDFFPKAIWRINILRGFNLHAIQFSVFKNHLGQASQLAGTRSLDLTIGGCEGNLRPNGNTRHFRKTAPLREPSKSKKERFEFFPFFFFLKNLTMERLKNIGNLPKKTSLSNSSPLIRYWEVMSSNVVCFL